MMSKRNGLRRWLVLVGAAAALGVGTAYAAVRETQCCYPCSCLPNGNYGLCCNPC